MKFGGKPCIDVGDLLQKAPQAGLPAEMILASGANQFSLRSGARPSSGRILLRSDDYQAIADIYAGGDYVFGDLEIPGLPTIKNIWATSATRLFPAANDSDAAPMMVDIADERFLKRTRFAVRRFNLHNSDGLPIYDTTNVGTLWTWTQILQNLWSNLDLTGTFAAPASLPAAAPEGLDFNWVGALDALESVLNQAGYTITHNFDGTYSFVEMGLTPATRTWKRVYDGRDSFPGGVNQPTNIISLFKYFPAPPRSANAGYGIDSYYNEFWPWSIHPSPDPGFSGNSVTLRDGHAALRVYGTNIPSNWVALAVRAQERADAWMKQYNRNKPKNIVYDGYQVYAAVGGDCTDVVYLDRGFGKQTEIISKDVRCEIEPQGVPLPELKAGQYVPGTGYLNITPDSTWVEAIRTLPLSASNGLPAGTYLFTVDSQFQIQMDLTNPANGGCLIYAKLVNYTTGAAIGFTWLMMAHSVPGGGAGEVTIEKASFTAVGTIANGDQISVYLKREPTYSGVPYQVFAGNTWDGAGPVLWYARQTGNAP